MSKAAHEVVAALQNGAMSVYDLATAIGRTQMSTKTIVFELRRSGYVENAVHSYPAKYRLTEKASEPIVIEWKKREPKVIPNSQMVALSIKRNANSVFNLGAQP